MALVCTSCEHVPDAAAQASSSCVACGAMLVRVDDQDPLIGSVLDSRFQIRERLGSGAMGVVYRATQMSIGRDVAVKVMTGMDVTAVKRFFREAQIASALSHPNTVQIIEFGQSGDGRVYLAMELVRGHTLLDEVAAKGALPSRRICRIGIQLCDALEAAHRMTIVHRDLKPENVMIAVDETDHVKILDFGIARVLGDASSRVTGVGLSAGTPSYMAPEVLGQGAEPEAAQDMYALGVMIAELALGRSMWSKTTLEMLYVEKTSNAAVEQVPLRLRPLVRRLTDLDPAKRPTATETRKLLRELDRAATDPVGVAATMGALPPSSASPSRAPGAPGAPALDPTPDATLPVDPMPALDHLDVVDLAEHTGAATASSAGLLAAKTATTAALPDVVESGAVTKPTRFDPPALDPSLELDGSWKKEKERRIGQPLPSIEARRSAAEESRRRNRARGGRRGAGGGGGGLWLVLLLILGGGGAGAYYWMTRPEPRPVVIQKLPDRGVTIRIVGRPGTPVTLDGAAIGKTPVSLNQRASKREVAIGAPGVLIKIVPDHTQTVDITKSP